MTRHPNAARFRESSASSAARGLIPAPLYTEPDLPPYELREPVKEYHSSVWQAIIGDGVIAHLDPRLRNELSSHYSKAQMLTELTDRNLVDQDRLHMLSLSIPMDPSVRGLLLQTLSELRGRTMFMDTLSGQMVDHIVKEGMVPAPAITRDRVSRYGTYRFCSAHGLPTRSFEDARVPLPN